MPGGSVGYIYVQVLADTGKLKKQIESAGNKSGFRFGRDFERQLGKSLSRVNFDRVFDKKISELGRDLADRTGDAIGDGLSRVDFSFTDEMAAEFRALASDGGLSMKELGKKIERELPEAYRKAYKQIESEQAASLKRLEREEMASRKKIFREMVVVDKQRAAAISQATKKLEQQMIDSDKRRLASAEEFGKKIKAAFDFGGDDSGDDSGGGGGGRGFPSKRMKAILVAVAALGSQAAVALTGAGGAMAALGVAAGGSLASLLSYAPLLAGIAASAVAFKIGVSGVGDSLSAVSDEFKDSIREGRAFNINAKEIQESFKFLSGNAKSFVVEFAKIKPALEEFRLAVQEKLFAGLDKALNVLVKNTLPGVQEGLLEITGATNAVILDLAGKLNTFDFSSFLGGMSGAFENVGKSLNTFLLGGLEFLKGIQPIADAAAESLREMSNNFLNFVREGVASGEFLKNMAAYKGIAETTGKSLLAAGSALNTFVVIGANGSRELVGGFTELITKFNEWMQTAEGTAAIEQFFASTQQILTALGPLFVSIGKAFTTIISPDAIDRFDEFAIAVGELVEGLGAAFAFVEASGLAQALADLFVPLSTALTNLQPQLSVIATAFSTVFDAIASTVGPILGQLAGIFVGLLTVISPVIASLSGVFTSLFATIGPVLTETFGVIAGAIGQIVLAFQPLLPVFGELVGSIVSNLLPVFGALFEIFAEIAPIILSFVGPALGLLAGMFEQIGPILTDLMTTLEPVFKQLASAIGPVIVILADMAAQVLPVLLEALLPIVPVLLSLAASLIESLAPILMALVPLLVQLAPIFAQLLVAANPILNILISLAPIIELVGKLLAFLLPPIINLITWLVGLLEPIISLIIQIGSFNKAIDDVGRFIQGLIGWVAGLAGGFVNLFKTGIEGVRGMFSAFGTVLGYIRTLFSNILSSIAATVNGWVSNLAILILSIPSKIRGGITGIKDLFVNVFNGIKTFVSGVVDAIVDKILRIVGRISGAIDTIKGIGSAIGGIFGGNDGGRSVQRPSQQVNTSRGFSLVSENGSPARRSNTNVLQGNSTTRNVTNNISLTTASGNPHTIAAQVVNRLAVAAI